MVFDDVTRDDPYDLVIADEGWEIDHFLHENPGCKRSAFAWLTDFVGWLPMPAGGDRERHLAADLNAQMLDQVARLPRVRDRAVFVGDPDDVGPGSFGPGLPQVRDWTAGHYAFSGYVAEPQPPVNRAELGYREDERVCLVTVGGSAVGRHLLMRVLAAAWRVPGLRMVVVTGRAAGAPWPPPGRRGAAGAGSRPSRGLRRRRGAGRPRDTMELTAARRPFVYVGRGALRQNVCTRLERYPRRPPPAYAACPERLAAVATEVDRPLDYLPVPPTGAATAAEPI
jgi:hypothetical protein